MAKPREIPDLSPGLTFRQAAARAVEVRAGEVFDHAAGVLDTSEIERLHDMRVATRRLRAVMEIFAPCFPRKDFKRLLRDVKELADALGERRDPDVHIDAIERIGAELTEEDRPGVRSFVEELREQQLAGNGALAQTLERLERDGLRERLAALAEEARTP
jgi:CHAD domain-containing protein